MYGYVVFGESDDNHTRKYLYKCDELTPGDTVIVPAKNSQKIAHQAGKVFNDMLCLRTLCDDYKEVLALNSSDHIRIADMSKGKAHDDG